MEHITSSITYDCVNNLSELTDEDRELMQKAKDHLPNAYAPYSQFRVASAVSLSCGQVVLGSNQENASYPLGICGERVAMFSAQSLYPDEIIETVAISVLLNENPINEPIAPCGACRQVMIEIQHRQKSPIRLLLNNGDEKCFIVHDASQLLPISFHKGSMGID